MSAFETLGHALAFAVGAGINLYATVAILAAVAQRERTGSGQYIDLALFDSMIAMLANMNLNYLTTGVAPGRAGNAHQNIVPYQVFAAADGHVVIAVGNDGQYAKFCAIAGRPDLADDPRYAKNADRVRNRAELVPLLEAIFAEQDAQDWLDALAAAGIPAGRIRPVVEALDSPEAGDREMVVEVPTGGGDPLRLLGIPVKLSATPGAIRRPPPALGEHTAEVLSEIGFDPDARLDASA